MKKFIGTKTVHAEHMTKSLAIAHKLIREDNMGGDVNEPGYHVIYENGYHSWSPADVFEKAYKVAETPEDRMLIECDELTDKMLKLSTFMESDKFKALDEQMRGALKAQYSYMMKYANLLVKRLWVMEQSNDNDLNQNLWMGHLSFGVAVDLLEAGFSVRRTGWNGKGMYVVKQVPQEINEFVIPKMNSLPYKAKELLLRGENKCIRYRNQMLLVQPDGTADSWIPSSSDVFADDWELVL